MKIICIAILFLLCGCSPINVETAKEKVSIFHELYQRDSYSDIYKMTSSSFKKATSEQQFTKIIKESKSITLGEYKKSKLKTETTTRRFFSNNEVSLIYYSEYSRRVTQEIFVFEIVNGETELEGYRYDAIN